MNVKEELVSLIKCNCGNSKEICISENTDLIRDLQMDSIEIMQLIVDTEEYFKITFDDVDLLTENFSQFGKFSRLIEKMISIKGQLDVN
ncbi:MAG: acyl carrier protein [Lachnospiraceae bacterium]|nr:acyl carrier protein [Lachnospiraceae bacterium]